MFRLRTNARADARVSVAIRQLAGSTPSPACTSTVLVTPRSKQASKALLYRERYYFRGKTAAPAGVSLASLASDATVALAQVCLYNSARAPLTRVDRCAVTF